MIDEFDKKAIADETDENTTQTSPVSGINLVDLLRDDMGNKIRPETSTGSSPAEQGTEGRRIKELGDLLNPVFEQPLSRTEQLLLKGMNEAIRSGNLKEAQEMLGTLAENPASVDRVMRAMQAQMKYPEYMSWEQGTNNRGQSFVRLHLSRANDDTKSSGRTEVTIGSDGRNSASYTERWNSPQQQLDPEQAIGNFAHKRLRDFREMDDMRYRPLHFDHYDAGKKNQI